MSSFSRFRSALLLLAALCACALPRVTAQIPWALNVNAASGQIIGASYRLFAGTSDTLIVTHSGAADGEGTILTLTCVTDSATGAGLTVSPASQCLSSGSVGFKITAGAKAVGASPNTVTCTFAVSGLNPANFGSAPTVGAITIRAPQRLTVPSTLAGAMDINNPMPVYVSTNYDFTYLAGTEEAAVGAMYLTPTCTTLGYVSNAPAMDVNLNLNMTLSFGSDVGNMHCTMAISASDPLDEGRFGTPASLYFKIRSYARTDLVFHAENFEFSATANTTNYVTITPTPSLVGDEWLEVTMTGCSPWTGGIAADVQPVWGMNVVRWGSGATANPVMAVRLPMFGYAGVMSTCYVSFDGSWTALQRYQLEHSYVEIIAGKKIQLTAELDLITRPVGMFNPILGTEVALRIALPQGVNVNIGTSLGISVSCGVPCKGNNGALSSYTPSRTITGDWMRNSTGDLTNGPLFLFRATLDDTKTGTVECTWELSGDDAVFYTKPSNTYFNIRKPLELDVTADSGLNSPITSEPTESYTKNALNLGNTPTITITVGAPQRNLDVQLTCNFNGVLNMTVSGASSNSLPSWTSGLLTFTPSGSTAGKFMIAPVFDPVRLNGRVECSWSLSGEAVGLYATPASLNFYIGGSVQLKAVLNPAPQGQLVWGMSTGDSDATVARVNVTAVDPSALVGMAGLRVNYVCVDDHEMSASLNPSSLVSIATGSFGYGSMFTVKPYTSTSARYKNQGATLSVKCEFELRVGSNGAARMDVRAYKVPDSISISFQPQPTVAVAGTALLNNPVASASTKTLDFTLNTLPRGSEMVTLNISCPGFQPQYGYVQWYATSERTQTTSWVMPTVSAGNGWTVQCTFTLWSDNYRYRMEKVSSASITIGTLRTFTQSPATIPTVWAGQTTELITLTPSGCMADGEVSADCYNDADLENTWGSVTFSGSGTQFLYTTTDSIQFVYNAPSTYKYSSVKCTFQRTWYNSVAPTKVAFEEIGVMTFQLGDKARIVIDGMGDGRQLNEEFMLSVRPTATVGVTGLTVDVECYYRQNGWGMGSIATNGLSIFPSRFYWFTGTSESQQFKLSLPSTPTPTIFNWYCTATVVTATGSNEQILADSDRDHFSDYTSLDADGNLMVYWVGNPWRYSLGTAEGAITGTPFLQRSCGVDGSVTITVRMAGDAPSNTLLVQCRQDEGTFNQLDLTTVANPTQAPSQVLTFPGSACGEQALTFTVHAGSYEGKIVCTYTSLSSPISQVAPAQQKMYAGTFDPNAISEADKLSKGAIAGIVIGCIVGAGLIVLLLLMILKKGPSGSAGRSNPKVTQAPPPQQGVALVDMQGSGAVAPAPQLPEQTS